MSVCRLVYFIIYRPPPQCARCANTVRTKIKDVFSRRLKAASVELGLQGPEDCSRRTDQQWQKPGGGRTCWVGDVVRAVDFALRNGDVSGWTVGRSERRGTEVLGLLGIDGPWRPAWTSHDLWRQTSKASHGAAVSVHDQTSCLAGVDFRSAQGSMQSPNWPLFGPMGSNYILQDQKSY